MKFQEHDQIVIKAEHMQDWKQITEIVQQIISLNSLQTFTNFWDMVSNLHWFSWVPLLFERHNQQHLAIGIRHNYQNLIFT